MKAQASCADAMGAFSAHRWRWRCVALALLLTAVQGPALAAEEGLDVVRFALDRSLFRDLNKNDGDVAVHAYTRSVGEDYGLGARVTVVDGLPETVAALQRNEVDLVGIQGQWLTDIPPELVEGPVLVPIVGQRIFEEYVLLVRTPDPAKRVADLKGRRLIVSTDLRSELLSTWLEVLFHDEGLAPPRAVLGSIVEATKPAQVVLPVFFGKADACVVTRAAWETMGELNPQVRAQLRAIATSPPVIPGFSFFRRGIAPGLKALVRRAVASSQDKPAFRQILTLFRLSGIVEQPESALDSTRELVIRYQALRRGDRTRPARGAAGAGPPRRP